MSDPSPSTLDIRESKARGIKALSWIWLVPILALIGSLGLVVQSYLERDVEIVIQFPDAGGIEVGSTQLRFRDVTVGQVAAIDFAEGLTHVDVTVTLRRDMAAYVDADTRFWLVTAEVTAQGISGLDTLLSGAYITAEWDAEIGTPQTRFVAEASAPIVDPQAEGLTVVITSTDAGSVSQGAPVLYKGIQVGTILDVALSEIGGIIEITAFIEQPYDTFVNTGTRFWNVSGIDVTIGDSGLNVQVASLASLLEGGIAFETSQSGGAAVSDGVRFDLYASEDAAKDSVFDEDLRSTVVVSSVFEGSLQGIREGTRVLFSGLKVGEVRDLFIYDNPETEEFDGDLLVVYSIQPARLGYTEAQSPAEVLDILEHIIATEGFRARLQANSILDGGLHVELFSDPSLPPATLQRTGYPNPLVPSVPTPPETLRIAAASVMERVAGLPIESLMDHAIQLIEHVNELVASNETRQIPATVNTLLGTANTLIASDPVQTLPQQLTDVIGTIDTLLRDFEEQQGVEALTATLKNLRDTTANVAVASEQVPGLLEDIDAVVATAEALPLDTTIALVNQILVSADRFITSDGLDTVPVALSGALEQVRDTLAELRAGGATQTLTEALASTSDAADAIAVAAASLPELAAKLEALADTADATIGAYGPQSPVNREVQAAIADLRQAVASLNALITAVRRNPNTLIMGR